VGLALALRFAARSYLRTPGFTAVVVVTIALGVGVNAALSAFVGGLLAVDLEGGGPDGASRLARVALLLAGASGLVLFLACSTVASLLLGRARARAGEVAVRLALGARRQEILRLCIADVVVVTACGGALGGLAGYWTAYLVPLLFFVEDAEQLGMVPDASWLAGGTAVWLITLFASVVTPLFVVSPRVPASVLKREAMGVSDPASGTRRWLITTQIALCCVLLVIASATWEDLRQTLRTARGLELGSLIVAPVRAAGSDTQPPAGTSYMARLRGELAALPDVTGVAFVSTLPGGWMPAATFVVEPRQPRTRVLRLDVATFDVASVDPETLKPVAGRLFGFEDAPNGCRTGLLNQAAADRYFDSDAIGRLLEPVGQPVVEVIGVLPSPSDDVHPTLYYYANQVSLPERLRDQTVYTTPLDRRAVVELGLNVISDDYFTVFADPPTTSRAIDEHDDARRCGVAVITEDGVDELFEDVALGSALIGPDGRRREIVGLVKSSPLAAAQRTNVPTVLIPLDQAYRTSMVLAVRVIEPTDEVKQQVTAAVQAVPGGRLLGDPVSFEEHLVRMMLAPERIATTLLAVWAAIALTIAGVGAYGAVADLVVRRRRELAVRIVLGAGVWPLIREIVRMGLRVATTGIVVGVVLAGLTLPVLGLVVRSPRWPSLLVVALAASTITLLVVSACAVPAWRAVHVDPREALQA